MARRHEPTVDRWERIRDRVPGNRGDPGRTGEDNRWFLNAVFFVLRTGVQGADLPERYGPYETQKKQSYRWTRARGIPNRRDRQGCRPKRRIAPQRPT